MEEAELAELAKQGWVCAGDLRELPVPHAKVEALKGGAAKDVFGERHVERPRAVEEDEVLDALVGEVRDETPERVLVGVEGDAGEAHAADGAGVRGHAARHGAHDGDVVGPVGAGEVGVVDEERGRGPHAAPARGEHDGPRGLLGGEARDDVGEERVREAADVVHAVAERCRVERERVHAGVGDLGVGGGEGEALVVGVVVVDLRGGDEVRGEEGEDGREDEVDALLRGRSLHGSEVLLHLAARHRSSAFAGGVHGGDRSRVRPGRGRLGVWKTVGEWLVSGRAYC